MAKIQIKNSFITSSAQITISSSLVRFSDNIRAKGITGSFSGSFAGSNLFVQGGNSFGTTALLGTNDNQALVLETNASEKMRVTAAGLVGIGTSSPIAKLHILGSGGGTDYVYQQWSYTSNVGVYDLILKQTVTSGVVRYNFSMNNASTAYNDVLVLDRGCVGIGTSFPLSKLDVRGTMYVNYGSNGTGYIQTNGTDSDLQITTATNLTTLLNTGTSGAMAFGAGNSERMRILSGGNIGIGTSSPTQKLEVAGYAMAGESSYRTSIYGNASGAWIAFGDTSNTVSLGRIGAYNSLFNINSVNGDTSFQYNGSEKMRITTGGNVGIGTTSPTAKLQVGTQMYGSAPDANYFVVGNENFSGPGPVGGITGYPATANRNQVTASLFDVAGGWESVNGYHALLRVSSYDKINSTPALTILNNGNLGLGTNSPSHQLTISRPTQASAYQVNFNTDGGISDGNYTGIRFSQGATGGTELGNIRLWYFTTGATALSLGVRNATQALYVATDGNIGIGTTNPVAKLHITGSSTAAVFQGNVGIGTTSFTYSTSNRGLLELYGATDSLIALRNSNNPFYIQKFSTNAYLNNTDNGAFILYTNNTERMRIAADGNVGIGTSSPGYKLDINGITRFQNIIRLKNDGWNLTDDGQVRFYFDTSGRTYFGSGNGYEWRSVADATLMVLTNAGNVGIGTTSPVAKLDINGTSNFAPNVYHSIGGQKFFAGSGGTFSYIYTGTTALNFINGSDTSTLMSLLNNGNLGIGTTTPAYKFHIYSGSMYVQGGAGAGVAKNYTSFSRLIFDTDHSDSTRGPNKITLYDSGGWVGGFGVSSDIVGYYSGGNHVWLRSTSQTAFTEYMRLNSSGNLGIGTSSPPTMLQVVGTGVASVGTINIRGSQAHLGLTTAGGTFKGWYGYFNSSTHGSDLDLNIKTGYAGASNIRFAANGDATQLFISGSGNVGIGTTSPSIKLAVDGEASFGDGSKLTLIGLDINSQVTPNFIKIRTKIPFASGAADFTINIKGFRYGSAETTSLMICWHYYLSTFYSPTISSAGSYAPTVKLSAEDWDSSGTPKVCIVLVSPGYWPKLYVESMYSSAYNDAYADGWDWVDADATGNNLAILSYKSNFGNSFVMLSNGSVGIGTTNPSVRLHVVGSSILANATSIDPDAYQNTVVAGAIADGSGWGVNSAIGGNAGLGDTWAIGHNGGDLYMALGNGSADNTLQTFLQVSGNRNLFLVPTSGNVGIGTTSPVQKFHIDGVVGNPATSGTAQGGIVRLSNTTDNAVLDIGMRSGGNGAWLQSTDETSLAANYPLLLNPNGGNVGIGSTAPVYRLDVNGGIASGGVLVALYSANYNRLYEPAGNPGIYLGNNSDPANYYDNSTHYFRNRGGSSNYAIINSNGNLGIGTSSPVQKLHVVGAVYGTTYGQFGTSVASGTNSSYAVFGSNSAVVGVKINIDSNVNRNDLVVSGSTGNVGIGTSQVLSKLNAYASGSNLSVFRVDGGNGTLFEVTDQLSGSLFSVNDVSGLPLLEVFSNNRVVAGKYGTNALVVSGSSVGIGTSRPAYRLQVSGSFAATTKSFVINHPDPAKSDKQLVHGVTEGPEHTVFVRGKLLNDNIIQLPDYWQYLVDEESITVTLTPNKYYQQLYVKNVTDKSIEVGSETDKPINCYYYIVGERKDIPKLITEI